MQEAFDRLKPTLTQMLRQLSCRTNELTTATRSITNTASISTIYIFKHPKVINLYSLFFDIYNLYVSKSLFLDIYNLYVLKSLFLDIYNLYMSKCLFLDNYNLYMSKCLFLDIYNLYMSKCLFLDIYNLYMSKCLFLDNYICTCRNVC